MEPNVESRKQDFGRFNNPTAAEWNRTGHDYSSLWRMYDRVVAEVRKAIKINAAAQ